MEKISSELRLIISRKFGSEETWDLDVLLNALKSELEARERCNAVKISSPTNSNPSFDQHKGRFKQPLSSSPDSLDSLVHLIYYDPSDLGSLIVIRIMSKER